MRTMEWTDGKLEERLDRIDGRFKGVDQRFEEVNRRITEGREETKGRFDRVEGDIAELKATLNRIMLGLAFGFLTVLGTILVKGG